MFLVRVINLSNENVTELKMIGKFNENPFVDALKKKINSFRNM
jgi:hypothetical protein